MEKKITHIFRKEKGQIVVQGEVNLTDIDGNKIHVSNADQSRRISLQIGRRYDASRKAY